MIERIVLSGVCLDPANFHIDKLSTGFTILTLEVWCGTKDHLYLEALYKSQSKGDNIVVDSDNNTSVFTSHKVRLIGQVNGTLTFEIPCTFVQEQQYRTSEEYEQVGFHKCHQAMFSHEMEGKLYCKRVEGFQEASLEDIVHNYSKGLYKKVVERLTEREYFIKVAQQVVPYLHHEEADEIFGAMFDSGEFKVKG